ncbi:ATP-binding cassette domain-containing protein [Nocardia sp. NPDC058633]|uniref:ATP-binding cassette domain-containing protein n=1 Tax=Nocardia sp. NPDC058633 TaxID=3346568 RepID=UPI0036617AFA
MTAELRDLTVHVDTGRWRETVLSAVDLVVPPAQITALLGESGCGKSMLAASLAGRLPPTARADGEVLIDGEVVPSEEWSMLRGRTVGYVPQEGVTAFAGEDTVGAQLRKLEGGHRGWSIDRACAAAHYPADALDLLPREHSGGQIQRAALAAALVPAPRVLIVDEPTASLDTETAYGVWRTLREYANFGAAVLVVTHGVQLLTATGFADRMVMMRGGRIVAAGTPAQLFVDADPYVQGFFTTGF